jgi:hypothetical protein
MMQVDASKSKSSMHDLSEFNAGEDESAFCTDNGNSLIEFEEQVANAANGTQ